MKKQFLETGRIVGTHGIKGEVRIEPWCDSPQFLCAFKKLYLDEKGETFFEVKSRPHKNIVLAKIKGVETIDQAERLRGKIVYINRDDITLGEGVEFVQDLIGARVIDADNDKEYGTLTDVLRTGANDVYEIGNKIREAREALGMSQDDLADVMGTSRKSVSRHETGEQEMKISAFFQYYDALNARPEQLLPDRLQMTATPLEERLLKAARDLSESNLEVLIMVAERMK